MSVLSRGFAVLFVALGVVGFSQAPEFAQQYRQRLGGAVDELARVVAAFDADAARNGLARREALSAYSRAPDAFLNDRGRTMSAHIARLNRLTTQSTHLDAAPPLLRPGLVLRTPDRDLIRATLASFEPALPLTQAGAVYGGAGGALGFLMSVLFGGSGRVRRRARRSVRP